MEIASVDTAIVGIVAIFWIGQPGARLRERSHVTDYLAGGIHCSHDL